MADFDVVIVGGGILGVSISYFLSHLNSSKKIGLVEQAPSVAFHTSKRNTGKVHAPYLYHPEKKRLFAKASFWGYEMWKEYANSKNLPFKSDGVIEVALDNQGIKVLEKYQKWALQNGLVESDMKLMDKQEIKKIEPEILCESALYVYKDASADYHKFTESLMYDSMNNGVTCMLNTKVVKVEKSDTLDISLSNGTKISAKFLINAAGGNAIDIAHELGLGQKFTDVHFRGEYWKAPAQYAHLTKTSVYSVPEFPEYPFLDPHWIVRIDGTCEIGPNAVPVFSPYGYDKTENLKEFLPKLLEMLGSGARKTILDRRFQELAIHEVRSSISKSSMVNRVKRFLPHIDASKITQRGTAGIRSSVIDADGKFVPDVILLHDDSSFHILNYNSPGATGALPFSAYIVNQLHKTGLFQSENVDKRCGQWMFSDIVEKM